MIESLLIYNLSIFSSFLFAYLGNISRDKIVKLFFFFISFSIIFLVSAVRYNVGTDYPNYVIIYNNLEYYTYLEVGYYHLNYVLNFFNMHPQWIFVFSSFIFCGLIYLSMPNDKPHIYIFYFILILYLYSFNGVRQSISIAFALWAFQFLLERKTLYFSLLIIMGSFFHVSCLIILPLGFLSLIKLKYYKYTLFVLFSLIILIILSLIYFDYLIGFLKIGLEIFGSKYSRYFESKHFFATELKTGLGVLSVIVFSLYCIFIYSILYNKTKEHKYGVLIFFTIIYIIAVIFSSKITIFNRVEKIFVFSYIYNLYYIYRVKCYKQLSLLVVCIFTIYLIVSIQKTIITPATDYHNPRLIPYQTVISIL